MSASDGSLLIVDPAAERYAELLSTEVPEAPIVRAPC